MLVNMKRVDLQAIKSGPKFKLLYNIEATAHFSVKTLKECQDTVHNSSFNTFGAKIGWLIDKWRFFPKHSILGKIEHFNIRLLQCYEVQGPPYILARHEIAIFSKSAGNFQKLFFTKQGCGYNDCLNKKIFFIWFHYQLLFLQILQVSKSDLLKRIWHK